MTPKMQPTLEAIQDREVNSFGEPLGFDFRLLRPILDF